MARLWLMESLEFTIRVLTPAENVGTLKYAPVVSESITDFLTGASLEEHFGDVVMGAGGMVGNITGPLRGFIKKIPTPFSARRMAKQAKLVRRGEPKDVMGQVWRIIEDTAFHPKQTPREFELAKSRAIDNLLEGLRNAGEPPRFTEAELKKIFGDPTVHPDDAAAAWKAFIYWQRKDEEAAKTLKVVTTPAPPSKVEVPPAPSGIGPQLPAFVKLNPDEVRKNIRKLNLGQLQKDLVKPQVQDEVRKIIYEEIQRRQRQQARSFNSFLDNAYNRAKGKAFLSEEEFLEIANGLENARNLGVINQKQYTDHVRYFQKRMQQFEEELDQFGRRREPVDPGKKPSELDIEPWGHDVEEWQLDPRVYDKASKKAAKQRAKIGATQPSMPPSFVTHYATGAALLGAYGLYKGGQALYNTEVGRKIRNYLDAFITNYLSVTFDFGEVQIPVTEKKSVRDEDFNPPQGMPEPNEDRRPQEQSWERLMRRMEVQAARYEPERAQARETSQDDDYEDEEALEEFSEAAIDILPLTEIGRLAFKGLEASIKSQRLQLSANRQLSNLWKQAENRRSRRMRFDASREARKQQRTIRAAALEKQKENTKFRQRGQYLGDRVGRMLFEVLDGQKEPFTKAWQLSSTFFVSILSESVFNVFGDVMINFLDRITGWSKMMEKLGKALETFLFGVLGMEYSPTMGAGPGNFEITGHQGLYLQARPISSHPLASAGQTMPGGLQVHLIVPDYSHIDMKQLASYVGTALNRYSHRWQG